MLDKEITLLQSYQKVFSGPEGKAVLRDLISNSFMTSPTIAGEEFGLAKADILMSYREGMRGMMLHIFSNLQIKPDEILQELSDEE